MEDISETRTAFFYGTLMSPEVLYRVIYGTTSPDPWQKERLAVQPALLYGYQRHRVRGADYPAIFLLSDSARPASIEAQRVLGTLVRGLSDMDVMRLDVFEGDQYDRLKVEAFPLERAENASNHSHTSLPRVQAETYVWRKMYVSELDPAEWDYEEFRREKLRYWAGPDVMRDDYDVVDAAVAELEAATDGTGGRGTNGKITRQLTDLRNGDNKTEPLKSAV